MLIYTPYPSDEQSPDLAKPTQNKSMHETKGKLIFLGFVEERHLEQHTDCTGNSENYIQIEKGYNWKVAADKKR